jgi:DNA-binding NarL/FixJ family response regulator
LIIAQYQAQRAELREMMARSASVSFVGDVNSALDLSDMLSAVSVDVLVFDDESHDRVRVFEIAASMGIAIVVLADLADIRAVSSGSSGNGFGILLRDATWTELAAAIVAVAARLTVYDDRVAALMALPDRAQSVLPEEHGTPLSPREREVLDLIARGLPNKQIASRLGISTHTVKFHIGSILIKLGAASRAEAVTLGARRGELLL